MDDASDLLSLSKDFLISPENSCIVTGVQYSLCEPVDAA